jgi:PhnB protein
MNSRINPYINFNGNAKEAIEFYKSVFGGELTMSTYQEGGMPHNADEGSKIMHAMLVVNEGMVLMASDTPHGWPHTVGTNMSVSLSGDNDAELQGFWDKLSADAKVDQPLVPAPWGDKFGMLTDKFGVRWMVNITAAKA